MANNYDQFIYDNSRISKVYAFSRKLSDDVIEKWMKNIKESTGTQIKTIIDLGCGTGRFTSALSESFNAAVIGIDPSRKMLKAATGLNHNKKVKLLEGYGEKIPLDLKVDMIFLSMVYHHLMNKDKFIKECHRLLRKGGFVVIRNATKEDILYNKTFQFFPTAEKIDLKRLPGINELNIFLRNGFKKIKVKKITQASAANGNEFLEKISKRSLSALNMISDEEFKNGLTLLKKYFNSSKPNKKITERFHLFIYQYK